jgi:hypothetical protein
MKDKRHAVVAAFKTTEGASAAVDRLMTAGFEQDQVSLLLSQYAREHLATLAKHSKPAQGAVVGGLAGGMLGAVAAALTSFAAVSFPVAGIMVGGPLVAAIVGGGAGAAAGGLVGALIGLGLTEHEAVPYRHTLEGDAMVVTVGASDKHAAAKAVRILRDAGAIELGDTRGRPIRV